MLRSVALSVTLTTVAMMALAEDQSARKKSGEPDAFDIEPPVLKQNLSPDSSPAAGTPEAEVARLEKRLERARKDAAGAERLWKIGVLAKVEVEQRQLKVVQCEADLANARVAQAREEVARQESRVLSGENAKADLDAAQAALAQLTQAAQAAAAKRERAELEFAEANLRRQQKLLKLGSAHKSDVERAEEKLAELKAQNGR
jgi:multidrug resistance efflux pump